MTVEPIAVEDEQRIKAMSLFAPDAPKIYIAKDIAMAFPMLDAALLSYIGYRVYAETPGLTQLHHDEVWLVQKMPLVAAHLGVPSKTLEGVVKRLKKAGVLVTVVIGNQRKLFWRLDIDNLLKIIIPANTGNTSPQIQGMEYKKNEIQNSGNTNVFPGQPAAGGGISDSFVLGKKSKLNVAAKFRAKKKPKKEVLPDEFIEHWNSLPHTPKCMIGHDTYERSRAFFKAYQKYEIGTDKWLLPEEYKPILAKLNREAAHKKGSRPTERSREEMIEHIETAALVFNPEYYPPDKNKLKKRGLSNFLFNQFSPRTGRSSAFIKFVHRPPQRHNDVYALFERQDEHIQEIAEIILGVYYLANQKDPDADPSEVELSSAIKIAHNIAEKYMEIPVNKISKLAHHFPHYQAFMKWWKNYMEDAVWSGMPITALDPSKDLWRRFTDFVSADIGWHLFTGERVN